MASKGKILIIGAGLAGLTAAHYLKEAGYDVLVFEKETRPGGRIQAKTIQGDVIDVGAQFYHTNYKICLDLIRTYQLDANIIAMNNYNMIMKADQQKKYIRMGSILGTSVSLWSRLVMTRLVLPILLNRKSMALDRWPGLLEFDQVDLAAYTRRKLNEEILEYAVRPLMLTYSMSEPETISLSYFLRSFYMYLTTGSFFLRGGNDLLTKALAQNTDIKYQTTIKRIITNQKGEACGLETEANRFEGSAVISAIPSPELFPLYADWDQEQRGFLQDFEFARLPMVVFVGSIKDTVSYWGGINNRLSGHRVSYMTYPHQKGGDQCKARYMQAWPLGDFGRELIDAPDDKVIQAVSRELEKHGLFNIDPLQSAFVIRHQHTYPQFRTGMFQQLINLKNSEGNPKGLFLAGDYTEGGLLEGAAQSGFKAAQRVIAAG